MTRKVQNIKKPNTLIIGAPRCGTTKIYKVLGSHPSVYMSKVKEPAYFCPGGLCSNWEEYLNIFSESNGEKIIGEASTGYLHGSSPRDIKNKLGRTKIIVSIRDPIERSKSHYRYKRRNGKTQISFKDFIRKEMEKLRGGKEVNDVLKCSLYWKPIERYEKVFGKENVKVILFENFVSNMKKVSKKLCKFLNIDGGKINLSKKAVNVGNKPLLPLLNTIMASNFYGKKLIKMLIPAKKRKKISKKIKQINVSSSRYNISINKKTKQKMVDIFGEDVRRVAEITSLDLSRWSNSYREEYV